jgi:hypothetical protein
MDFYDKSRVYSLSTVLTGLNKTLQNSLFSTFISQKLDCPYDQRLTSLDLLEQPLLALTFDEAQDFSFDEGAACDIHEDSVNLFYTKSGEANN